MAVYAYQFYYNHQQDKYIDEAMKMHNKSVNRYLEINNELRAENEGLKHNFIHEQAMYYAAQNHVELLEEQINVISHYWRKEYIKVSDELFDLKNATTDLDGR